MESVPIKTELVFATWPRRAVATLVDVALGAAVAVPAALLLFDLSKLSVLGVLSAAAALFIVAAAVAAVPCALLMARTNGQTPGKRLLGVRVVHVDGSAMTVPRALYREGVIKVFLVDVVGGSMALGFVADWLWPIWDEQSRAIHDVIAGTWVIRA